MFVHVALYYQFMRTDFFLQKFKVVDSTLVEWSESLKISVTSFSGHAESIFHKKTHCHRTQFWNNHDLIIQCSYGKTHIRAFLCDFLGLRYVWVIRISLKTKPMLFLGKETNRWSLKRAWYLTASGQDPGISPRHGKTKLSRSLF